MDTGMTRQQAESVAALVHDACAHGVEVVQDGGFFVVQVNRESSEGTDTYTLYDDADWSWLRERIVRA
jgi:hypothetical protein